MGCCGWYCISARSETVSFNPYQSDRVAYDFYCLGGERVSRGIERGNSGKGYRTYCGPGGET